MPTLVPTAAAWLKKYSTWIFTALAFAGSIQPFLPLLQIVVHPAVYAAILAVIAALGILATQIQQYNLYPKVEVLPEEKVND